MSVAAHFNAEMAERHGTEKLAATIDYLETTDRVEQAGEATALKFRVPGASGKFESIPFAKASSADIDRARQLVVASRTKGARPRSVDGVAQARVTAVAAALAPAPKGSVRGQRVEVERAVDGKHRYTFRGISEDELEAFARAVLVSLGSAT